MSKTQSSGPLIRYRCRGCDNTFTDSLAGIVACPRCHSIADHEQLGHDSR